MERTRRVAAGRTANPTSDTDPMVSGATQTSNTPGPSHGPPPALTVGDTLLAGRFSVTGLMGEGGMGVVYEAHDRERSEQVAIKTLLRVNAAEIYRLKGEFRSLAGVVHPNLVRLHELFVDDGHWYFSMELVEGVPFMHWVRPGGVLDHARLRAALPQLRDAILAIHIAGKLHRDLKPSNVLITASGRVVVLDFGLALDRQPADGDGHEEGRVAGTPAYMAPEQAGGQRVSAASDLFALGVMLFEALTGQLPHKGHGAGVLLAKQVKDAPRARALAPDAPEDLDALCAALLARDPSARPDAQALRLLLGDSSAHGGADVRLGSSLGEVAPLVGRDAELSLLREAALAARNGPRPVVVLLSGESGIGKSALVAAFLEEQARDQGAVVLRGRCYEREVVPYKAFDALVDALSRHLSRLQPREMAEHVPHDTWALRRLFPVLSRVPAVAVAKERELLVSDAQEVRRRGFLALAELLAHIAQRSPLALHVDDLQWTDADSTALLLHVLQQPDAPRILLILAHRADAERDQPLLEALYDALPGDIRLDVRTLRLGPLPASAAEELARRHDAPDTAELLREAGGNPFLLGELARRVPTASTHGGSGGSLSIAVRARVSLLPEPERRLLEVLSVAARPLPLSLLAEAAAVREGAHAAMDGLQAARLACSSVSTDGVECYHDRIREAVAGGLTDTELRACHRSLADALEQRPEADPEHLFMHYEAAGELSRSARHALTAARRAERMLAFERAVTFYDRALSHGHFNKTETDTLRLQRADALSHSGRGPEAAEAYLQIAASADGAVRPELEQKAAEQFLMSGHLSRGHALLVEALAALDVKLPRTELGAVSSLLYRRARLRLRGLSCTPRERVKAQTARQLSALLASGSALSRTDALYAAEAAARHLSLALREGTAVDVARALVWEVLFSAALGATPDKVREIAARAEALCVETGDLEARAALHRHFGFFLYIKPQPDLPGALRELDASLALYREHALPTSLYDRPWGEWNRAVVRGYLGHYAELARELPAHLHEAWSRADLCIATMWAAMVQPRLAVGDERGAERDLARARGAWSQPGFTLQDLSLLQAEYHLGHYRGDARTLYTKLEQACTRLGNSPVQRASAMASTLQGLRAGTAGALAARASGTERADLLRTVRAGAQTLRKTTSSTWAGQLWLPLEATAQWLDGDREQALSTLRHAVELLTPIPSLCEIVRRQLGMALGGDEGRALVVHADAFFGGQGVVDPERFCRAVMPGWQE